LQFCNTQKPLSLFICPPIQPFSGTTKRSKNLDIGCPVFVIVINGRLAECCGQGLYEKILKAVGLSNFWKIEKPSPGRINTQFREVSVRAWLEPV